MINKDVKDFSCISWLLSHLILSSCASDIRVQPAGCINVVIVFVGIRRSPVSTFPRRFDDIIRKESLGRESRILASTSQSALRCVSHVLCVA